MTYALNIKTDVGTYMHGYHLGTDLEIARQIAEQVYFKRIPKVGTRITSVAIVGDGEVAMFDGKWN